MIIYISVMLWALNKIAFPAFFIFAIALISAAIYKEKQNN